MKIHGTVGTVMYVAQGAVEIVVGDTAFTLLEGDGVAITWNKWPVSLQFLLSLLHFPATVTVDDESGQKTAAFEPKPVGR